MNDIQGERIMYLPALSAPKCY